MREPVISRKELAVFEHIGVQPEPTYLQLNEMPDEDLMALVKQGDHDAFASVFDRYYRLILSITYRGLKKLKGFMQGTMTRNSKAASRS
jgi:hypothetical protein